MSTVTVHTDLSQSTKLPPLTQSCATQQMQRGQSDSSEIPAAANVLTPQLSSLSVGSPNPPEPTNGTIVTTLSCECKHLLNNCGSVSISYILGWIPTFIGNMCLGHLPNSSKLLSSVGLARVFSNITAVSLIWGMLSGLYTLIPQALGQNKTNLLRFYVQRAFYIALICSIPLVILQAFASKILACFLTVTHEQYLQVDVISTSCLILVVHVYSASLLAILRRLMQGYHYNRVMCIIYALTAAFSVPLCYTSVFIFNMSYVGVVATISVCSLLNMVLALAYLVLVKGHGHLFRPVRMSKIFQVKQIKKYLALSVPGIVKHSFEWWFYELTIFMSGYISSDGNHKEEPTATTIAISCAVIMHNMFMTSHLIGVGVGRTVSSRIGKYVGRGDVASAKICIRAAIYVGSFASGVIMTVIGLTKDYVARAFTNDEHLLHLVSGLMLIFAASVPFVTLSAALAGVYSGIGRQRKSSVILFFSYYGFSLPLGVLAMFGFGWKDSLSRGSAVVFGMVGAANVVSWQLMQVGLLFLDWDCVTHEAMSRVQESTRTHVHASVPTKYGSTDTGGHAVKADGCKSVG